MKTTQQDRILDYIKEFGSITSLDAYRDLGITKLTTRISEMRRDGIKINGKSETTKNRFGEKCHFYRYTLAKEDEQLTIAGA